MKKLTSLALAISLAGSFVYSPTSFAAPPADVKLAAEQKLNVNLGSFPDTIDPGKFSDNTSSQVARAIFDTLYRQGPNGDYIPVAAERAVESSDGLTWTFYLRKDATWQDGKPVTAADFVYSWQRLSDPSNASTYGDYLANNANVVNAAEVANGQLPPSALGVKALDDFTLEVKLTKPTPWLVQVLSYQVLAPVRQDLIEKYGDAWVRPENIVGNGPYKLVRYAVNDEITLTKVDSYWDAKNVTLTDLRFVFILDPNTAYYQYTTGELLYTGIPPQLKDQILKERPQEVRDSPRLATGFIDFNQKYEPLQDVRVRRALALLTDNKFIVERIYAAGTPTSIFVPTYVQDGQLATQADYWDKPLAERQAEAKRLLTEAGYTKDNPLRVELSYYSGRTIQRVFVALQSQYNRGSDGLVRLTGSQSEWKSYLDKVKTGDYQLRYNGWGADYDQASTFYNILTCGNGANYGGYCNQEYDKYVNLANQELNAQKRAELYAQANKVLQNDQGTIPFNWGSIYALVSPALGGYNEKNEERFYRDYYIIADKAAAK
ncbi:hypothetical protein CJP74_03625 [Psittacicella melopsittaci]|uniref:Solute-binding protein family 5 domain-containing protein n=1 Tax=Psittacicella melopsittaci TaxID=2028576 RepID=A0A3A1Y6F9_9GAMM|nr:peptide ABC transporter substrate-binding protein [Psittacicella melopsittaci]RIY32798.1 hypothetical protein CJP74_03625 [Psittacicella melopsittaci]